MPFAASVGFVGPPSMVSLSRCERDSVALARARGSAGQGRCANEPFGLDQAASPKHLAVDRHGERTQWRC
eukprot:96702-Alexandrium_andersonii.AAC.1